MTESPNISSQQLEIEETYRRAVSFNPRNLPELQFSDEQIFQQASQEASYGRVVVDEEGWTQGMRALLRPPLDRVLAQWDELNGYFNTALQPYISRIEAHDRSIKEINTINDDCIKKIESINNQASVDHNYEHAKIELERISAAYDDVSIREGHRKPNMLAYSWVYWLFLLLIGAAEWLINYETFFQFFHIPAMAAGTTIILGLLLAFSAHGHGTILRQWTARFGQEVDSGDRWGDYRLLILSTLAVAIVIVAAGGSRYAWALNALAALPTQSIIPGVDMPQVNPLRDVLLSLLGNVGAWIVGVFIAYLFHDKNPKLMDWTHQLDKARKRFSKLSAPYEDRLKTAKAQAQKKIEEIKTKHSINSMDVENERIKRDQVRSHEEIVQKQIVDAVCRNAQAYQRALCKIILSEKGAVVLVKDDDVISPFDYQNQKITVNI